MTAQQLKNSILQLAVQGKLVPQDPNDEPASVLLQRIKAEKQELIKAGKIKKDKKSSEIFRGASRNLPYTFCEKIGKEIKDISDEIPFEIPDSWEWVRCSTLGAIIRGSGIKRTETVERGLPCVRYGELYTTYNTSFTETISFIPKELFEQCKQISCGNVLFTLTGENKPDIAKTVAYLGDSPVAIGGDLAYWTHHGMNPLYLVYFMSSPYAIGRKVNLATGDIIVHISGDKVGSFLIPVPPLAEQDRIVAQINELETIIQEYHSKEQAVSALNTSFPEALKKSILQEAVQGKLVPQNPDDEPASVLLERIRAEKQKLIKAGKIKKSKHESVIITRDKIPYEIVDGKERCIADEVPFEIPESWCWCRLSSLATKITDGTHHSPPNTERGEYKYITAKNIKNTGVSLSNITYVSKEIHKEIFSRCNPEYGDVLLIKDGATTGVVTVNNIEEPFSLLSSVALIKCPQYVDSWYLVYVLRSDLFYKNIRSQMKGTGITRVTLKQIEPLFIPMPPLEEQKRIVSQIEKIMPYINTISK